MERNYSEEERYNLAKKRVQEVKGFYGNLTAYIVINAFFVVINLLTSPEHLWFYWPMLGWGIGVIFHGLRVFNYMPFLSKDWEERKMKEFMEEEERRKNQFK
jgi:hypothetical protein